MLNTTQDDVYDLTTAQIVSNVVAGYNGTVMCYGQTGSGKTFSMLGLTNNYKQRGIIPRAVQQVYHEISMKFDQAITIRISYCEIYNEKVSPFYNFVIDCMFRWLICWLHLSLSVIKQSSSQFKMTAEVASLSRTYPCMFVISKKML